MTQTPFVRSSSVQAAFDAGTPIVALESTIITHGMPYPQNLEMARQVEATVRAGGAEPATIAVIDGTLFVGLEDVQLETLAQTKGAAKLSRADMAVCLATGGTGATTVAATMIAASLAGISVFATGGIGGVHRGAEESFDISADLQELAQTAVTVVAAGAKAILDVSKTLEVLETLGVPVIAYGQDAVPGFWSAQSIHKAPLRLNSASEIAKAHLTRAALGLPGGQLIGNPIPQDAEIPRAEMEPVIERALQDAETRGIIGKSVTPYLLQRVFELTEGRSLSANIALVLNNAAVATQIAREMKNNQP
ncbi:MAG: pseudouridine-5'-phosphate glycosidase [Planktotalea sp.]|uniref:pseudouridine-5'-phosphate glycosidase n=1 Tax=Planktotalea sp. TaxID=2029877 RepID=UPI00261E491C|nr:pseudouridine-5'-phosphate glycosidase [Planktotalea sp.]MDG1082973.1 pseudouridine-5'-phosphate glycosidase [Planktotalea sp.]